MRTLSKTLMMAGFVAALAAAPLAGAAAQETSAQADAQSSNQTVPSKAADAWITTKVKSEFATAKKIHATDISVETTDGVVKLSGSVASTHEKTKAERIAKKVKGVKSVDGTGLTVSGSGMSSGGMKSDSTPSSGMSSGN